MLLIFSYHRAKIADNFCSQHCIIWVPLPCPKILLKFGNVRNFYFRLTLRFFTCHILAQMREYGLGKDLFQNVWVVALELAGDMLQLVLQVYGDILAGSFQGES